VPPLTEERRKDLVKVAGQYAESARVSIRNVRRDGMELLKKVKDTMGEDENKRLGEDVQKLTDEHIKKVDTMLADKEKDIMTV
jgi:ribosome recycling factor